MSESSHILRSQQPGSPWGWGNHFVLGNGRLGAALGGRLDREIIRLNEETIWSRSTDDHVNPDAKRVLPEVRRLLRERRLAEAEHLADAGMMGVPRHVEPYQPIGTVTLRFAPQRNDDGVERYERVLDLSTGVAEIRYARRGVDHHRRAFISHPDGVFAMRLIASQAGQLSFCVELDRPFDAEVRADGSRTLRMTGKGSGDGTRFVAAARVLCDGGTVEALGNQLLIREADAVTLLLACETDYWETFRGRGVELPYDQRVDARLAAAEAHGFDRLLERHVADHASLYRRASLTLGDSTVPPLTTDQLLQTAASGTASPALFALQFNFARYLLIASSRAGGLPTNLQGIWSDTMTPAWNCDFHTNINLQMNYWFAEAANLSELHRPLFDWLTFMSVSGARTAEVHYGCRGWTMHHLADAWGFTAPADAAPCGLWPMGAAWCALHAWEHYLYNEDRTLLAEQLYPILRGAALFLLDYLQPTASGELVTGPSSSPENSYRLPNGESGMLCMGPTMDHQITRELFNVCIESARLLAHDEALVEELAAAIERLPPTRVGRHGTIMEWHEDHEEVDPGHRHHSHLFALYPGTQISIRRTPELAAAARQTLARRLAHQKDEAEAGWSYAWKACLYARLGDAEAALDALNLLARHCTLPNLLSTAHGVTQVDAAFGCAAGILEMLLQSHDGTLTLLPALPDAWPTGSFRGLRAPGSLRIDAAWHHTRLTSATLYPTHDLTITLATGTGQVPLLPEVDRDSTGPVTLSLTAKVPLRLDGWSDPPPPPPA